MRRSWKLRIFGLLLTGLFVTPSMAAATDVCPHSPDPVKEGLTLAAAGAAPAAVTAADLVKLELEAYIRAMMMGGPAFGHMGQEGRWYGAMYEHLKGAFGGDKEKFHGFLHRIEDDYYTAQATQFRDAIVKGSAEERAWVKETLKGVRVCGLSDCDPLYDLIEKYPKAEDLFKELKENLAWSVRKRQLDQGWELYEAIGLPKEKFFSNAERVDSPLKWLEPDPKRREEGTFYIRNYDPKWPDAKIYEFSRIEQTEIIQAVIGYIQALKAAGDWDKTDVYMVLYSDIKRLIEKRKPGEAGYADGPEFSTKPGYSEARVLYFVMKKYGLGVDEIRNALLAYHRLEREANEARKKQKDEESFKKNHPHLAKIRDVGKFVVDIPVGIVRGFGNLGIAINYDLTWLFEGEEAAKLRWIDGARGHDWAYTNPDLSDSERLSLMLEGVTLPLLLVPGGKAANQTVISAIRAQGVRAVVGKALTLEAGKRTLVGTGKLVVAAAVVSGARTAAQYELLWDKWPEDKSFAQVWWGNFGEDLEMFALFHVGGRMIGKVFGGIPETAFHRGMMYSIEKQMVQGFGVSMADNFSDWMKAFVGMKSLEEIPLESRQQFMEGLSAALLLSMAKIQPFGEQKFAAALRRFRSDLKINIEKLTAEQRGEWLDRLADEMLKEAAGGKPEADVAAAKARLRLALAFEVDAILSGEVVVDAKLAARLKTGLSDVERAARVREILKDENLVEGDMAKRLKAVEDAHNVGQGELGKDGKNPAAKGNYTEAQLRKKMRILRDAGFSKAQADQLVREGIVGLADELGALKIPPGADGRYHDEPAKEGSVNSEKSNVAKGGSGKLAAAAKRAYLKFRGEPVPPRLWTVNEIRQTTPEVLESRPQAADISVAAAEKWRAEVVTEMTDGTAEELIGYVTDARLYPTASERAAYKDRAGEQPVETFQKEIEESLKRRFSDGYDRVERVEYVNTGRPWWDRPMRELFFGPRRVEVKGNTSVAFDISRNIQEGLAMLEAYDRLHQTRFHKRAVAGIKKMTGEASVASADGRALRVRNILTGENLDPDQMAKRLKAVEDAHDVGQGELGKDGKPAAIGNYTEAQLRKKMKILRDAGFSKEQADQLVREGIVGAPATAVLEFPEEAVTDQVVRLQAEDLLSTDGTHSVVYRVGNLVYKISRPGQSFFEQEQIARQIQGVRGRGVRGAKYFGEKDVVLPDGTPAKAVASEYVDGFRLDQAPYSGPDFRKALQGARATFRKNGFEDVHEKNIIVVKVYEGWEFVLIDGEFY